MTRMQTVHHGGGVWATPSDQMNGLRVQEWDLVAGEEVEVVERVEVASSDLRFEREDLGLTPLRGDETWLRCCVGRSMHMHARPTCAAALLQHTATLHRCPNYTLRAPCKHFPASQAVTVPACSTARAGA